MGTHIVNVGDNLKKTRLSSLGDEIGVFDPDKAKASGPAMITDAIAAFEAKEGCLIQGYVKVN